MAPVERPEAPPAALVAEPPSPADWPGAEREGDPEAPLPEPFELPVLEEIETFEAEGAVAPVEEDLMVTTLASPAVPLFGVTVADEVPPEAGAIVVAEVEGTVVAGAEATVVGVVVTGAEATVVGVVVTEALLPAVPVVLSPGAARGAAPAGRAQSRRAMLRTNRASAAQRTGRTPSFLRLSLI